MSMKTSNIETSDCLKEQKEDLTKQMPTGQTSRLVYISGPITGTNDYLIRFSIIEGKLKREGYEVINPAVVNAKLPQSLTWDDYMHVDLAMLDLADTIYLMEGWQKSKGASAEAAYAMEHGKIFMKQENGD